MDFNVGGRGAIERMVEAYGFTTRQALCDKLGVSKSSLATRYMRDSFPSDWVIQCALETGVSLEWLVYGSGESRQTIANDLLRLPHKKIIDGQLFDASFYFYDKALLPLNIIKPAIVSDSGKNYFVDFNINEIIDGTWLLDIEGKTSIKKIMRIPVGKVKITNDISSFECLLEDIKFLAKCDSIFMASL